MRLSASNIGWTAEQDRQVYGWMKQLGCQGVEIAPTRLFPAEPYRHLAGAAMFAGAMAQDYGFVVSSMQSIWYGRAENIFDPAGAEALAGYTGQAVEFAFACHCKNLVFGCPRNRNIPQGRDGAGAEGFLRRIGSIARRRGAVIALEANPPMYNTNFLNTTKETLALARRLAAPGISVNLDLGAMVAGGETVADVAAGLDLVSHVHLSEPGLAPIQPRPLHRELAMALRAVGYRGFVSLEMKAGDPAALRRSLDYLAEVFG